MNRARGATLDADTSPARGGPDTVISPHAWRVLLVTSASTFIFVLDSGILSISFPQLAAEFSDSARSTLSWAFTGYSVVMAALMAFAGSFADRVGRKRVYLSGLALYTIGAVLTTAAPTAPALIGARLIQGAGSAFFITSALALALVAFPVERRATALAMWGVVGSVAAILAPTAGAALLASHSWRWTFGALAGFSGITLVLSVRLVDDDTTERTGGGLPDPIGVVVGALGVAMVTLAVSRGPQWGWIDPHTDLLLAAGLGLLPLVARRSRYHPRPLVPPVLLRQRIYSVLTLACVIQQIGFFGYFFSLPLILTGVWHWSVLEAGYAMAVSMAVSAVVAVPAGKWAERHGYTGIILAGAAITASAPVWWIATFSVHANLGWALLPGLVIQGTGSSIVGNLTTGAALRGVPVELMGSGNSLHQMSRRVGGAIGVALSIALLGESVDAADLLSGARRVWVLLIVVHVVMAALVVTAEHQRSHAHR